MKRQESLKLKLNTIKNWKERFIASDLTISGVAKSVGVSRQTIHNAINGSRVPNVETINKIEELLKWREFTR